MPWSPSDILMTYYFVLFWKPYFLFIFLPLFLKIPNFFLNVFNDRRISGRIYIYTHVLRSKRLGRLSSEGEGDQVTTSFLCLIPSQQEDHGVHYNLTFLRGKNNIHNNHKVFLFLGEETRSCAYFHDQRGRVKLQHCGSSGQGAVWSVDVVGTSNRHTNSSCQTQDPPAPRAPGSPAVASAHVRAVDSSREGNLKTVLDSSATQRNTVQGARFRLKLPSISHKQVRFLSFIILCSSNCVCFFFL